MLILRLMLIAGEFLCAVVFPITILKTRTSLIPGNNKLKLSFCMLIHCKGYRTPTLTLTHNHLVSSSASCHCAACKCGFNSCLMLVNQKSTSELKRKNKEKNNSNRKNHSLKQKIALNQRVMSLIDILHIFRFRIFL